MNWVIVRWSPTSKLTTYKQQTEQAQKCGQYTYQLHLYATITIINDILNFNEALGNLLLLLESQELFHVAAGKQFSFDKCLTYNQLW